jgi:hypothetical protein
MPQKATAISVRELTAAVNTAVASAGKRFPKIPIKTVNEVSYFPYLIMGFPVPDPIFQQIVKEELGSVTAFAAEVAGHLAGVAPEAAEPELLAKGTGGGGGSGALLAFNNHIIMGRWLAPAALTSIQE